MGKNEEDTKACACGCGEAVGAKSTFRPGHDARLVSNIVAEVVRGESDPKGSRDFIAENYGEKLAGKFESAAAKALAKAEAKAERERIRQAGDVPGFVTVRGRDREAMRNKRGIVTYVDSKGETIVAEGKVKESFVEAAAA